jgi:predicted metal-binding membrane protein
MKAVIPIAIRDRTLVIGGLAGPCLLAWLYLFYLVWMMERMPAGMAMIEPQLRSWTAAEALLCFVMWAIMMVGMMIPSAAPMILIFSDTYRKRAGQGQPLVSTGLFVLGYLAVWTAFSLFATAAQWGLQMTALLSPTLLRSTSPLLGGAILIAAGLFQWTDLKRRCLTHCRSPLNFLLNEWREGRSGAFVMGLRHGLFCLGCCWALMGLLFVTGVMNLLWVALIGGFVLLEKVVPLERWVSGGAGVALTGWGLWLLLAS